MHAFAVESCESYTTRNLALDVFWCIISSFRAVVFSSEGLTRQGRRHGLNIVETLDKQNVANRAFFGGS